MRKTNKIVAMAMSAALLVPSVSHASDINSIISGLYDGMDAISEAAGTQRIPRPALPAGGNTVTTTTTTVITTTGVVPSTTTTKDTKKANEAKIAELKASLNKQDTMILAAEDILTNYPKTIAGKEEKLVDVLTRAYDLRIKAAAAIQQLTGEKVAVRPLNVPLKYRSLIRTY